MEKIMSTKNNLVVKDIMISLNKFPVVDKKTIFKIALEKMSEHHLGIACIIDDKNHLLGILTDGDIRRKLLNVQKPFSAFFVDDALKHSIKNPTVIDENTLLTDALDIMEERQIWDLPVVSQNQILVGLLHLHPVVKSLVE
jgi:CBS domain-containing protein